MTPRLPRINVEKLNLFLLSFIGLSVLLLGSVIVDAAR